MNADEMIARSVRELSVRMVAGEEDQRVLAILLERFALAVRAAVLTDMMDTISPGTREDQASELRRQRPAPAGKAISPATPSKETP